MVARELGPGPRAHGREPPGDGRHRGDLAARRRASVVVLLSTYDEDEFDSAGCGAAAYVSKAAFSPERLQQVWRERDVEAPRGPAARS